MIEVLTNPNEKSVSLQFPSTPQLDGFSKIIMTHSHGSPTNGVAQLEKYSWLAQRFCEAAKDIAHVDLIRNPNADVLTLVRRTRWTDRGIGMALQNFEEYLQGGYPLIHRDAIEHYLSTHDKFEPKNIVDQRVVDAFEEAINNKLLQDGGAIEISGITIDSKGEVVVHVLMLGSCSGCGNAEEETLEDARAKLKHSFEILHRDYPDNPDVQKLHLGNIIPSEAPAGFIMRM